MNYAFISGIILALALTAAVLFFRGYRRTKDRLFALFGVAFVVLAGERFLLGLRPAVNDNDPIAYIPRILAFTIILIAIIDRNRR